MSPSELRSYLAARDFCTDYEDSRQRCLPLSFAFSDVYKDHNPRKPCCPDTCRYIWFNLDRYFGKDQVKKCDCGMRDTRPYKACFWAARPHEEHTSEPLNIQAWCQFLQESFVRKFRRRFFKETHEDPNVPKRVSFGTSGDYWSQYKFRTRTALNAFWACRCADLHKKINSKWPYWRNASRQNLVQFWRTLGNGKSEGSIFYLLFP